MDRLRIKTALGKIMFSCIFSWILLAVLVVSDDKDTMKNGEETKALLPTVFVALFVRNKAHVLPYFLHYFEDLDYPKDRMALWIRADHNTDRSVDIVDEWLSHTRTLYHSVDYQTDSNNKGFPDEIGPCDWSVKRFGHMMQLRQEALMAARERWADYIFFTDVDNILKHQQVLTLLMAEKKTIVAPMLNATASEHYSNFWGAMDEQGYYERSDDYKAIQLRHQQGCFNVPLVHSTFLISLRDDDSRKLSFKPDIPENWPYDDIIVFGLHCRFTGVNMYIINTEYFGMMLIPMESENIVEQEASQFTHLKIESIIFDTPLQKLGYIAEPEVPVDNLGFDQIYLVNLERRPDRRENMLRSFTELGIHAKLIPAVDGRNLNDTYLQELGVRMLDKYTDPYHGRVLTMGEIGCFLSHYFVWKDMVEHNYQRVIVFEDDIRFQPYFREKFEMVMSEVKRFQVSWDLVYLGRKRLNHEKESWVDGAELLVWPYYSYWTLSYMLSQDGAKKLLAQEPLRKMVPVDEYFPIMFDSHPNEAWKTHFSPRDLLALSAQPLLVYPTYYTGEPGYITDTEDSSVIDLEPGLKGDMDEVDSSVRDEL